MYWLKIEYNIYYYYSEQHSDKNTLKIPISSHVSSTISTLCYWCIRPLMHVDPDSSCTRLLGLTHVEKSADKYLSVFVVVKYWTANMSRALTDASIPQYLCCFMRFVLLHIGAGSWLFGFDKQACAGLAKIKQFGSLSLRPSSISGNPKLSHPDSSSVSCRLFLQSLCLRHRYAKRVLVNFKKLKMSQWTVGLRFGSSTATTLLFDACLFCPSEWMLFSFCSHFISIHLTLFQGHNESQAN